MMTISGIGKYITLFSHSSINITSNDDFSSHLHNTNEILLFIQGDAEYTIDGRKYLLKPYDLLIIPAGTYHNLTPNTYGLYENYVINFKDDFLSPNQLKALLSQPHVFNVYNDKTLMHNFKQFDLCYEGYSEEDFVDAVECGLKQTLLHCIYSQKISSAEIERKAPIINSTINYINENLASELNANIIASALNVSASHLQNLFSKHMKIGLKQYIVQKKIIAVSSEVKNGCTIIEASSKFGFTDYSTFYRQYKKLFGSNPFELKKNNGVK